MADDGTRSAGADGAVGSTIVTYSCGSAARFCVFWSVLSPRGCGLTSFGAEAYGNCIRFWRGSLARLSLSHCTSGATQLPPPRPTPPAWPRSSRSRRPQPELAHRHQRATRGLRLGRPPRIGGLIRPPAKQPACLQTRCPKRCARFGSCLSPRVRACACGRLGQRSTHSRAHSSEVQPPR